MTVTEMEAAVRAALNEPSQSMITSAEILNALNDGYKDIAVKALCVEGEVLHTIDEGIKISRLNYLKPIFVRVDATVTKFYETISLAVSGMPTMATGTVVLSETPVSDSVSLSVSGMPTVSIATAVA